MVPTFTDLMTKTQFALLVEFWPFWLAVMAVLFLIGMSIKK